MKILSAPVPVGGDARLKPQSKIAADAFDRPVAVHDTFAQVH